jgi:hypothetical protein
MEPIKSVSIPPTRRASKKARPMSAPVMRAESRFGAAASIRNLHIVRPSPLYRVGQTLMLLGGGNRWARTQAPCRVLAVLPHDSGPFSYRVRSEVENYERIVVETDLALFA